MSSRGDSFFLFGGGIGPSCTHTMSYLCLGKDDFSTDDNLADDELSVQPPTEWESIAMRRHPEILELREALRPLTHQPSSGRMARYARTEKKSALSHRLVLQLIMEHLENEGCRRTLNSIERESNIMYIKPPQAKQTKESQLLTLLRLSQVRLRSHFLKSKDLFDPDLPKPYEEEFDKEVEVIDRLPGRGKDEEADVFIWDEPPDSQKNIIRAKDKFDKVQIKAGTLNKLVEQLASDPDKPIDLKYIQIFVHTHQSFTTSQMFLKKLTQRYQVPMPKGMKENEFQEKIKEPIAKRVCNVIRLWIERAPSDFDEKLLYQLNHFIDNYLSRDGHQQLVKMLRSAISKYITNREEEKVIFVAEPPEPKVPIKIFSTKLSFKHIDEEELARQLTLMHFDIYKQIQPTELLNKSWCDPYLKYKAPNVLALLGAYQDVSLWVATNVLAQETSRRRLKLIEKFIKIAKHLRALNNYHTLFAVLSGLDLAPVQRLNRTFTELPLQIQTTFSELVRLVPPEEGDSTAFKELFHRSVDTTSLPAIPYFNVILRDLLVIEDSYPSKVGNLINFEKRELLYQELQKVQEYQRRVYNLQPVHQVRCILKESISAHKSLKDLEYMASNLA